MSEFLGKINGAIKKIDSAHLVWCCLLIVFVIMLPILILGKGAVFPVLDQLDETILNYVFPARFSGRANYAPMMCSVPSTSLKPFAPGFVVLYKLFSEYAAFVIQHAIVIMVACFGTYMCVKKLTGSSIIALLCAGVFALLPFRSIYGVSLSGTPFLVACILGLEDSLAGKKKMKSIIAMLGIGLYAVLSSLVLVGYAVIVMLAVYYIAKLIFTHKSDKAIIVSGVILVVIYLFLNIDLVSQLVSGGGFESHREEFVINGFNFWGTFKGIMINGMQHYESFHKYIYIPIAVSVPFAVFDVVKKGKNWKLLAVGMALMVVTGLLYAFFASDFVAEYRNTMSGMLKTFQAQRFFWLLVGGWYILLGISLFEIWNPVKEKSPLLGMIFLLALYIPTLIYVGKNEDSIFYQNLNEINNGNDITGYITWESLYAEDLMKNIEEDIGLPMEEYRIAHLCMSPVASLMHGFYTVDGYSNDYPLDYKHKFAQVIDDEIVKNDICYSYFYEWGNRCYLFYSEFGGAYMLGKTDAEISGMSFDLAALRDLGCRYIFSGCRISDAESQGLNFVDVYEDDISYWRVWVYEL